MILINQLHIKKFLSREVEGLALRYLGNRLLQYCANSRSGSLQI